MIIEWTRNKVKVIPCTIPETGVVLDKIVLLPGMNEVKEEKWKSARHNVLDQINRKIINEIHAEVKVEKKVVEDPETKEKKSITTTTISAKQLSKIPAKDAEEIVKKTFNLETLKKWKKKESRESVRMEIMNQIEAVETLGEDKAKKKAEAEDKD